MNIIVTKLITDLKAAKTDAKTFRKLLERAAKDLKLVDHEISDRLGVSRPTVSRWRNGVSVPWEPMRQTVYRLLIQLAEEKA